MRPNAWDKYEVALLIDMYQRIKAGAISREAGLAELSNNLRQMAINTRDTEAVKRISTAYLKLLFPHVQDASEIAPRDFKRYCFERARKMRQTIKFQVGILDEEYRGKDMPAFKIKGLGDV